MADDTKKDPELPLPKSFQDMLWIFANKIFKREAILVGVLIGSGAFGAIQMRAWAFDRTVAIVDAGTKSIKEDLVQHKEDLVQHKKDEAEKYTKLEAIVEENRKEQRQGQYRQDMKMDALLGRFGVPNPAPTPPPIISIDAGK